MHFSIMKLVQHKEQEMSFIPFFNVKKTFMSGKRGFDFCWEIIIVILYFIALI